jgi:glyoxylase-like metal-dependent hydrolase (beta-lactamase superfamily II)
MMKLKSKGCNVYLTRLNERIFLIDTGMDGKMVAEQIKELDGIIITHAHFDHIAGARDIERTFGCPVFAHPDDIPYILREKDFTYSGILGKIVKFVEKMTKFSPPENLKSVLDLKEIKILHTPGHTPGSICIFEGEKVYCGDLLRENAKLSHKSFCNDYGKYLDSVRTFLNLEWKTASPGHGGEIEKSFALKKLKNF